MNEQNGQISRKVLFVDDEALLLEGIKRQLRRELDITLATSGVAGLDILKNDGPFAVVVSDFNMPGMDGIGFLQKVHEYYPDTVLIMLTGRAELDVAINALHHAHISRFLSKPCPKEVLLETISDSMEQYRLRISEQLLQDRLKQTNQQLADLNNHLEQLVLQKTHALQLQYGFVSQMAKIANSQQIIDAFLAAIHDITGSDKINLWLNPKLDDKFNCYAATQSRISEFSSLDCHGGVIAQTLNSHSRWLCNDSEVIANSFDKEIAQGTPYLCQPLTNNNRVIGLLLLASDTGQHSLDAPILEALASMANVAATALQSFWNREAFADAQDAIITALAKLSEYRDPETGAHLLRLKKYSALLCNYLAKTPEFQHRITAEFTQDLVRSSPLHDIGKVGIPDAILKKPGKLSEDEFAVMKNHAKIGGDTLRSVYDQYPSQNFIKCGMEIAYSHHEKWDGTGYPCGLKGEEIPLTARILALVDVYDALTCRRIYKAPFSREKAKSIILDGRGIHFDPALVNAFLNLESQFHQIAEEFADIV